jgi:hypothetical protein
MSYERHTVGYGEVSSDEPLGGGGHGAGASPQAVRRLWGLVCVVRRMAKVDQREALKVLTRAWLIELAQGVELDVNREPQG